MIFTFLMYIRVAQVVVNWSAADEDFFLQFLRIFFWFQTLRTEDLDPHSLILIVLYFLVLFLLQEG